MATIQRPDLTPFPSTAKIDRSNNLYIFRDPTAPNTPWRALSFDVLERQTNDLWTWVVNAKITTPSLDAIDFGRGQEGYLRCYLTIRTLIRDHCLCTGTACDGLIPPRYAPLLGSRVEITYHNGQRERRILTTTSGVFQMLATKVCPHSPAIPLDLHDVAATAELLADGSRITRERPSSGRRHNLRPGEGSH